MKKVASNLEKKWYKKHYCLSSAISCHESWWSNFSSHHSVVFIEVANAVVFQLDRDFHVWFYCVLLDVVDINVDIININL